MASSLTRLDRASGDGALLGEQVAHQQPDVLAALAQRRQHGCGRRGCGRAGRRGSGPRATSRREVAVGRRDDAHVDRARPRLAEAGDRAAPRARAAASSGCAAGSSPISSRNSVPPLRRLEDARRCRDTAPVKAPRRWPKSWLAASSSLSPAQLTATNGPSRRALSRWMARATSSLPVPVSPRISTVASTRATSRDQRDRPAASARCCPTRSWKLPCSASRRRRSCTSETSWTKRMRRAGSRGIVLAPRSRRARSRAPSPGERARRPCRAARAGSAAAPRPGAVVVGERRARPVHGGPRSAASSRRRPCAAPRCWRRRPCPPPSTSRMPARCASRIASRSLVAAPRARARGRRGAGRSRSWCAGRARRRASGCSRAATPAWRARASRASANAVRNTTAMPSSRAQPQRRLDAVRRSPRSWMSISTRSGRLPRRVADRGRRAESTAADDLVAEAARADPRCRARRRASSSTIEDAGGLRCSHVVAPARRRARRRRRSVEGTP